MKMNLFKVAMIAVVLMLVNIYIFKVKNESSLPENVLANVEALAYIEFDGLCVEWVDKNCWQPDQFASTHGTDYYATCSGIASTPGGKLECGAVSSNEPLSPYLPEKCLQCVKTANGRI